MVAYADLLTGVSTEYKYDVFGRRIEKHVDPLSSNVTRYIYDGWKIIEERNGSNAVQASYTYGNYIDEVLTMNRNGNTFFYHGDDLFNVHDLTDQSGASVESYDYGDYGEPRFYDSALNPIAGSLVSNVRLFNGREFDSESGFLAYRTRYLDPKGGRFTTRDTIGIWGDRGNHGNAFAYAGNNPHTFVDPYGEFLTFILPAFFRATVQAIVYVSGSVYAVGIWETSARPLVSKIIHDAQEWGLGDVLNLIT